MNHGETTRANWISGGWYQRIKCCSGFADDSCWCFFKPANTSVPVYGELILNGTLDLKHADSPELSFKYSGSSGNLSDNDHRLYVYASRDGGESWKFLKWYGVRNASCLEERISLQSFIGSERFCLRFMAWQYRRDYQYHETICIDEVYIGPDDDRVRQPVFNPPCGVYSRDINVIITCGTEEARIYYTLDGSEPDETSIPYREPIPLSTDTLLKSRAFKEGMAPSSLKTCYYAFGGRPISETEGDVMVQLAAGDGLCHEVAAEHKIMFLNKFQRGDANASGLVDIGDPLKIVFFKFLGAELECQDAADVNDEGDIDLSDAIYLINFLFRDGPVPREPFKECGIDETEDELTCLSFGPCK